MTLRSAFALRKTSNWSIFFSRSNNFSLPKMSDDETLARLLQEEFDAELLASTKINDEVADFLPSSSQFTKAEEKLSGIIDPSLDLIDPNPDLHALFSQFNQEFFWGKLNGCEVKWSPRMTLCAGVCSYQYRSGFCSIRLSCPLLKLRPRKDFVETLLHEMIHAYLFVTGKYYYKMSIILKL